MEMGERMNMCAYSTFVSQSMHVNGCFSALFEMFLSLPMD